MPVVVTLDAALARRGMTARELSGRISISETQLSLFRSGKVRGIRFSTLAAMCAALECEPLDLIGYRFDAADLPARDKADIASEEDPG